MRTPREQTDPADAGSARRGVNKCNAAAGGPASPRTELPDGWSPSTGAQAWAVRTYRFTPRQVADELTDFTRVHGDLGNEQADWSHAWFRYMRSRACDLGLTT